MQKAEKLFIVPFSLWRFSAKSFSGPAIAV
jgi:hypothetical protein